jgi:hypothetical protein
MGNQEALDPNSEGLKKAIEGARSFLLELHKQGLLGEAPIVGIVLEEIAPTPGGDWIITLGYRQQSQFEKSFVVAGLRPQRSDFLKTFTVKKTGEVVSMRRQSPDAGE